MAGCNRTPPPKYGSFSFDRFSIISSYFFPLVDVVKCIELIRRHKRLCPRRSHGSHIDQQATGSEMALYDAVSGLIVSWLSVYPSNEPPEARSGKCSSWLPRTAVLKAQSVCVFMHHCIYVATGWLWWTILKRSPTVAPLIMLSWPSNELPLWPTGNLVSAAIDDCTDPS